MEGIAARADSRMADWTFGPSFEVLGDFRSLVASDAIARYVFGGLFVRATRWMEKTRTAMILTRCRHIKPPGMAGCCLRSILALLLAKSITAELLIIVPLYLSWIRVILLDSLFFILYSDFMADKPKIILIDGNAILHRSYHAIPRFEIDGRLVNAIYGFISILFYNIQKFEPEYLVVAFDVKGKTFRDEIFDEYKAKRVHPPQEFYDQIPDVWEFVRTMEIPLLTKEGYEADDVIGTISRRINGDLGEGEIIIVTGDQDTLQLVDQRTKVAMPQMGKIKETVYDISAVQGKFGLSPVQIIDYKALSGDPSDNIPGVQGIGPKTAQALLQDFGTIEKVYEYLEGSLENEKIKPRIAQLLIDQKERAMMSKELATIKTDVELDFKLNEARLHDFDTKKVTEFLEKFRFKSLILRMPISKRTNGQQETLF